VIDPARAFVIGSRATYQVASLTTEGERNVRQAADSDIRSLHRSSGVGSFVLSFNPPPIPTLPSSFDKEGVVMGKKIIPFNHENEPFNEIQLCKEMQEFLKHPTFEDTEQEYFAQSTAARYSGISARKLVDLSNKGLIPCYNVLDRRTYKREDLDRFMQSVKWTPHRMKGQKD
jgi:hypothetical protein